MEPRLSEKDLLVVDAALADTKTPDDRLVGLDGSGADAIGYDSINCAGYALRIRNVCKQFGSLEVLRGINLDLAPGEFCAIVGRSGCGKSTLLRLISSLESISSGDIHLDNKPVGGIDPSVRFLFQEARILPWKRVLDNVCIGAPGKEKDRAKALSALGAVQLTEKANVWPHALSGGQKQRVSLARALVSCPRLLLLDEPLGALDALTRIEMQALIESIWMRERFTSILVTHDVAEAVALANRVLLIEHGQITMDISIELPRPRVRNQDFAHYEDQILERILAVPTRELSTDFVI
ncbi:MAG: ATP-binding cassette domain-containing protein [Coriobacteriales bacterium]|jgi:sulfonate transport system ATP-binding protein|nr:ATP-binding cassette domain-containing protein [Coriobacteriales bacterium]